MKRVIVIMMVLAVMFASCERKSGKLSRSGQAAMERVETKNELKTDTNIKVEIISASERILVDNGIEKYKVKVMCADSTVCYVLTNNLFNVGDKIEIKPTQRMTN
jgi:hypothetical protein